ncbi:hypothetical protein [Profundibacter sp.]
MKPKFALDLSHDGIGLLHRSGDAWHTVGSVSLDDTEFSEKLGFLRQTAAALESSGVTTKLVIPNSQILFTTVKADGPTDAERHAQIRSALIGATPYEIDDLAYDWTIVDGSVRVAAVARETLAEAESFANEHGFNPLSFVATPIDGQFSEAEPFFGTSQIANSLLDSADPLERDKEVIRILGQVVAPEQKALVEPEPILTDTKADPDDPEPETGPETGPEQDPPSEPEDIAPVEAPVEEAPSTSITSAELPKLDEQTSDTPLPTFTSRRESSVDADDHLALDRIEQIESRLAILPEGKASLAPKLGGVSRKVVKDTPAPATPTPPPPVKAPVFEAPHPPEQADIQIPPQATAHIDAEEQAMTVFGARKKPVLRGKPRYLGLTLLLLLLAVLGAIVLWSTFFLNDETAFWRRGQTGTIAAPTHGPAPTDAPATQSDNTAVNDALALLTEPSIRRDVQPQAITEPEPLVVAEPEDVAPPPLPKPMSPQTAQDAYLETGIWQRAPKAPNPLVEDEIKSLYITSADPHIASQDAIALPGFPDSSHDSPLVVQSSPAAHSAAFVLDERGLVIPSAQGTMTPDGVLVFAGPPPILPKARGNRVPQVLVEPDLRLAGFKPQARPADLVQQTQTAQETEQLGGYTRVQLAALRPKPRPYEVRPPQNGEELPEVDEEAIAAAVAEANAEFPAPISASPLAVVLSSAPKHRPHNFAKLVERARASAPSERATAATAVPRNQTIAPSAPTRASVARLATTKNAINLRRTSLIGVYGSPSKRRALVRLSNGRYVKVKVGQRVDGGKVAAIGQSELRYVKGGRTIILRMPKS